MASWGLGRELTIAVIQTSVKADTARPSSHTSDSCPSAEPQQGSNYSKLSPHQGFFSHVKKSVPNLHVIILRGMQHSGERVQGGRISLSVRMFVLKRIYLTLCVTVLCGQDYVEDDYCWIFWAHGSVWALLVEIPDLWGHHVLWPVGGGNLHASDECVCQ